MPQPLPYFNNDIDPTLTTNSEIKPGLYRYDEYQTYDYLYAGRFGVFEQNTLSFCLSLVGLSFFTDVSYKHNNIFNAKSTQLRQHQETSYYVGQEEHRNTSSPVVQALFDRFTPWDYPYASEYVDKIYDFYRFFSGSDMNDCAIYTGAYNPVTFQNTIQLAGQTIKTIYDGDGVKPDFNPTSTTVLEYSDFLIFSEINITLPATLEPETVIVTYYRKELEEEPATFSKLYNRYTTNQSLQQVKVVFPDLLVCSVVVSSSSSAVQAKIEEDVNNISLGYLHQNLDALLLRLKNFALGQLPRMNKFVEKVSVTFNWVLLPNNPANEAYGTAGIESYNYHPVIYQEKPDWYEFAGINYATNNYWQNGQTKTDIGQPLVFYDPAKTQGFQIMGEFTGVNQEFIPDTGVPFIPYQFVAPNIEDEISFDANYGGHVGYRGDSEGGETFNGFSHLVIDRVVRMPQDVRNYENDVNSLPEGLTMDLGLGGYRLKTLHNSPIVLKQYGDISIYNYVYETRHPSYDDYSLTYSGAYVNSYAMFTVAEVGQDLNLNFSRQDRVKYAAASIVTNGADVRELTSDFYNQEPIHSSVTANFVRVFREEPPPLNAEFMWTREQMTYWIDITKHYA